MCLLRGLDLARRTQNDLPAKAPDLSSLLFRHSFDDVECLTWHLSDNYGNALLDHSRFFVGDLPERMAEDGGVIEADADDHACLWSHHVGSVEPASETDFERDPVALPPLPIK